MLKFHYKFFMTSVIIILFYKEQVGFIRYIMKSLS